MKSEIRQAPRIAPLIEPYDPEIGKVLESMMPPGMPPLRLFRTIAHSPRVLKKIRASNLLDRGPLDRRDREIVILRTTARCGSEYEWGVHVSAFAARFDINQDTVTATATAKWNDPVWSDTESALVRLVDELHDTSTICDDLWAKLKENWSTEQLVELVTLVGFYHSISFLTNGLGVEREDLSAPFPPR